MLTHETRKSMAEQIHLICRKLVLSKNISDTCREKATDDQLQFVLDLFTAEISQREENKIRRAIKRANFPSYKTFQNYEYKSVKLPTILPKEELEGVRFVEEKKNLVLYGTVGLGKTHMAIAAGVEACRQGYRTKFYTVTGLVLELTEAKANNNLEKLLKSLRNLDLLILDEWGYVPIDREASQLLYRVIDDCYEKTSLILTTNLEFSKWGNIYTDSQMTAAMIDRIVHHGYLLIFEGQSYRIQHALMHKDNSSMVLKAKQNVISAGGYASSIK